jgi:hypothetical protein
VVADYALDISGDKVVLHCQVDDCKWSAEPAVTAGIPHLWDPDLMHIWADHLREVHPDRPQTGD